jgi:hypothetical protein
MKYKTTYSDGRADTFEDGNYPCNGSATRISEADYKQKEKALEGRGCDGSTDVCLAKGTKVTFADGIEKTVEEVSVGDVLKTGNKVNTVREIQITKKGDRYLYSVNHGMLVITQAHPILTQRGWTTIAKESVAKNKGGENWASSELEIGDLLIGNNATIKVTSIEKTAIKDAETYNFKLDGDNSFLANGVVVQGYDSVAISYAPPRLKKEKVK